MMDYVRISRNLREDADKTQTKIAKMLGTNELPIRHLISFCRYYQVPADCILGLRSEKR